MEILLKNNENELEDLQSQSQHITDYMNGFESILSQYREGTLSSYGGMESYTIGTLKASGVQWDIHSGLENFITDGIKKFCSMIWGWLEAIWNFVTGKGSKNSDKSSPKQDIEVVRKQEKQIEKITESSTPVILTKAETQKVLKRDQTIIKDAEKIIEKSKQPGGITTASDSEKLVKAKTIIEVSKLSDTSEEERKRIERTVEKMELENKRKAELRDFTDNVYNKNANNQVIKVRDKLITYFKEIADLYDAGIETIGSILFSSGRTVFDDAIKYLNKERSDNIANLINFYTAPGDIYTDLIPDDIESLKNIIDGQTKSLAKNPEHEKAETWKKQISIMKNLLDSLIKTYSYMKNTIKTIKDFQAKVISKIEAKKVELMIKE